MAAEVAGQFGSSDNLYLYAYERAQQRLSRVKLYMARHKLSQIFAWAIPNEDALGMLAHHAPIVEIGAGNGYWANLMDRRYIDNVPFDLYPESRASASRGQYSFLCFWKKVQQGGPEKAADFPRHTLFLCWPPMSSMAADALRHYEGDTVIYVGESCGGCNADEEFFDRLKKFYRLVSTVDIPQWDGIHDRMGLYKRVRPNDPNYIYTKEAEEWEKDASLACADCGHSVGVDVSAAKGLLAQFLAMFGG